MASPSPRWQVWVDRGGTFTDVVAVTPDGRRLTAKLLSEDPGRYADAAIEGFRRLSGTAPGAPLPPAGFRIGTTVATNALLERKGEPVVLAITRGHGDALTIGYQERPDLFARAVRRPPDIHGAVIEIAERVMADGTILTPLDEAAAARDLRSAYDAGWRALAIVLLHGHAHPAHEARLAAIAAQIGFPQISVSHRVGPLVKLVGRGDTTVVDAYLSPVLDRYVAGLSAALEDSPSPSGKGSGWGRSASKAPGEKQKTLAQPSPASGTGQEEALPLPETPPPFGSSEVENHAPPSPLLFMQSSGGLAAASAFRGKDAILSGPAGGIVGMVRTAREAGFDRVIGFDMGGTSTDVSHFAGRYERDNETMVAGARIRAPMMRIHTVAAGGGSICRHDGARFLVGPESAGAVPGPAAYRRGGPLTVTDCNVMLGKLQPAFFPPIFGPAGDEPLDTVAVAARFAALGGGLAPRAAAEGLIAIAVANMANAIKRISVARGHDVTAGYTLACFGGAGGQHACLVADALGMGRVMIHPLAGILSAYGMGLADRRAVAERTLALPLEDADGIAAALATLADAARADLTAQGVTGEIEIEAAVHLRYAAADTAIEVPAGSPPEMRAAFEAAHHARFGFTGSGAVVADMARVEAVSRADPPRIAPDLPATSAGPVATVATWMAGAARPTPVFDRPTLASGWTAPGPALIVDPVSTTVVEPGWSATVDPLGNLILTRTKAPSPSGEGVGGGASPRATGMGKSPTPPPPLKGRGSQDPAATAIHPPFGSREVERLAPAPDPIRLEIMNGLFMGLAEEMGAALQHSAASVNIRERLDFSCAIFDRDGGLVANAPHMPVHLGSMGESIRAILRRRGDARDGRGIRPGDAYALNAPYDGGTHLPDLTVVMPVFGEDPARPAFFVAARGHHADIGGITPGSMPPGSTDVRQEGVLFDNVLLVEDGRFREAEIRALLASGDHPARNPDQNVADLAAQIAACRRGADGLVAACADQGEAVVAAYMAHIQATSEAAVRRLVAGLAGGDFTYEMDDGAVVRVAVSVDRDAGAMGIDFTGTSGQRPTNFNAPLSIVRAAALYVVRCLIDESVPMNDGCLRPVTLIVPEGSMLNPRHPAAVVAGNVETSQVVTDALFGALGACAASAGTMNNFTFGDDRHQYYETIAGGSGAGPGFGGADVIQTHMTNSRLTDPEILETRFPVLLEEFSIRRGSGGRGRWAGGDGAVRRIRFLEPMTAGILANRRRVPPFGLAGGGDAKPATNRIERADGRIEQLGSTATVEVAPGDVVVIETPGGGGYGKAPPRHGEGDQPRAGGGGSPPATPPAAPPRPRPSGDALARAGKE